MNKDHPDKKWAIRRGKVIELKGNGYTGFFQGDQGEAERGELTGVSSHSGNPDVNSVQLNLINVDSSFSEFIFSSDVESSSYNSSSIDNLSLSLGNSSLDSRTKDKGKPRSAHCNMCKMKYSYPKNRSRQPNPAERTSTMGNSRNVAL